MQNLTIGLATNYNISQIKNFIKSYRKYHKDRLLLIVNDTLLDSTKDFLAIHDVELEYLVNAELIDCHINNYRFIKYYEILLKQQNTKNIFLTDVRDVVFQNNLFINLPSAEFIFFAEEDDRVIIGTEPHNASWILQTYGEQIFDKIKNQHILCAGTILGSYNQIIKYLITQIEFIKYLKANNSEIYRLNTDQAMLNYIVYLYPNTYKNMQIKKSGNLIGTIGITVNGTSDKKINPNNHIIFVQNNYIYVNNQIPAVIHQYDRSDVLIHFIDSLYL